MTAGRRIRGPLPGLALLLLCGAPAMAADAGRFTAPGMADLVPKFSVVLGGAVEGAGHYQNVASHNYLASGDFLYTIDGWGGIAKLDLSKKGERLWYNDLGRRNIDAWLQAARGMVLDGDTIFVGGSDGLLHWLDATSGTLVRSIQAGNPVDGFDIVAPPLVTDTLVVVAGSGDDRVGPLTFVAFDKTTGEPAWTAELGEIAGLSAAVRQPGVLDPERGQLLWPFTFPAIAVPEAERGAWAGSGVVALDIATGALRWLHREAPTPDALPQDGPVHLLPATDALPARLLQFRGNGSVVLLDAASGQPLADTSIYGLDSARVAFSAGTHNNDLAIAAPTATCENAWTVNGYASTVDVAAGLAYGANATACVTGVGHILTERREPNWLGAYYAGHDASLGILTAADIATGAVVAQRLFPAPLVGGATVIGEGLLAVTSADGTLYVLDAKTLEPVTDRQFAALSSVEPLKTTVGGEDRLVIAIGGDAISPYIAYRSPDLSMSEGLLVLLVMGLRNQ